MPKYSAPLLIAGLAGVINETLDRALLKQLLPNSKTALYELGLYGGFYKMAMIVTLFVQTFRYARNHSFLHNLIINHQKKFMQLLWNILLCS